MVVIGVDTILPQMEPYCIYYATLNIWQYLEIGKSGPWIIISLATAKCGTSQRGIERKLLLWGLGTFQDDYKCAWVFECIKATRAYLIKCSRVEVTVENIKTDKIQWQ